MRIFDLFSRKNYVAVIELSSCLAKIIQAKITSKGTSITKIVACSIAKLSNEEIAKAIVALINNNNINTDKVIAVMSREKVTVRALDLPATDPAELKQITLHEASRQIPFPPDKIVSDYRVLGVGKDGYSKVLLSIAHQDAINKILGIFKRIKLKPEILTLSSEGLYYWATVALKDEIGSDKTLCVVDIDRGSADIEIIANGKIALSRISSFEPGSSYAPGESESYQGFKDRILLETRRTIEVYNKDQPEASTVKKLVLTGSPDVIGHLAGLFKEKLNIEVKTRDSSKGFFIEKGAFSREKLPKGISLAIGLGALIAQEAKHINMLPREIKKRLERIKRNKKLFTVGLLFSCIFIVFAMIVGSKFYQKRFVIYSFEDSLEKLAPVTEKLELKLKKLQVINEQIEAAERPLVFLYTLIKAVPPRVLLSHLSFDRHGRINIQGTAKSMPDVFKLINSLEKSDRIIDVDTKYVSKRVFRKEEITDFKISCRLKR